jgi:predicted TIM-barrel fold metal-dependent hydrolase
MIVDSHAHVFQNWAGNCGHDRKEVQLRYLQKNMTRPSAKVFRARDGAVITGRLLFREGDNSWGGLRDDVNFRVGPYGRMEFTVEGEDYYVQYMPVNMASIESTPELMLAQMTAAGVDHCVLQAGMSYGVMNDYNAFAQAQYPQRFTGLMNVDDPKGYEPRWLDEVRWAFDRLHLRGLYFQLDSFSRYGFEWDFADARMGPFWELIHSLKIPVFIEASAVPNYDKASYVANMVRLDGLLERYPDMRWLLVMGVPVSFFAKDGRYNLPAEVERAYRRDNLQIELTYPIMWGGQWDYPYPQAQALIKDLRDRFGAGKLIWGSDMPNVERFCTYKQSVDYIRTYCEFLSAREKEQILGGNLADLCGIKPTQERVTP